MSDTELTTPLPGTSIGWRDIAWLLLTCAVALVLRWPFLNMPMIADEGGYAYATRAWLDGTGQLYGDVWISRPQGIFYLYALIFETLGTDAVAFRLAAWLSICGTSIAVWLVARRWRPAPVAAVAAMLFVVVSGAPNLEGYTANAEMFLVLPSAWGVWTLIRGIETRWAHHWVYLTGVLTGVATMLKPSGIVMLPIAIFAIVVTTRDHEDGWRVPTGWLLAGVATIGIPALIHGWTLGWWDFLYATVTYRLTLQSSATVGASHHLASIGRLALRLLPLLILVVCVVAIAHRRQVVGSFRTIPAWFRSRPARRWLGRAGRAVAHAGEPPAQRHATVPADEVGLVLRLWVLASLAGIAMGGDWWAHYAIQLAPPFSIWFAGILVATVAAARRWLRWVIVIGSVAVVLSPWWVVTLGSTESMSNRLFAHPGYQAQDDIAAWLKENSAPGTPIFVAFDQAAIYYLADRPPAYRHLYDQELRALPESYGEIISIIRSPERPLYIVSTRQPGPYPDDSRTFWQEVGKYYVLETMIDDIPIYRARDYTPPAP